MRETRSVGRMEIFLPPTRASFFIESLPEMSGRRYARQESARPRQARTSWASLNAPSGVSGPWTGSGQQKLSSAAIRAGIAAEGDVRTDSLVHGALRHVVCVVIPVARADAVRDGASALRPAGPARSRSARAARRGPRSHRQGPRARCGARRRAARASTAVAREQVEGDVDGGRLERRAARSVRRPDGSAARARRSPRGRPAPRTTISPSST